MPTRNGTIDLIRGVSILLVLVHHFNISYRLDDTTLAGLFGWNAIRSVVRNGNYGVTMFFVVSGYLITTNSDRRWPGLASISMRHFYALRVARILPCLLLLLTIVNLMAAADVPLFQNRAGDHGLPGLWLADIASISFWMNVLIARYGWFNYPLGVLWSLSVEEVFYLSFPLMCAWIGGGARLCCWLAIIVAGPIWRSFHQGDEGGYLYAYFASFDGIAIGCCTAVVAKRVRLPELSAKVLPVVVSFGMAALYLWRSVGETNVFGVSAMAFGTALLLLDAHGRGAVPPPTGSFDLSGIRRMGALSYELYLFHLVVLAGLRMAFPPKTVHGDAKLALLVAFVALSIGVAATIARFYSDTLNRRLRLLLAGGGASISRGR